MYWAMIEMSIKCPSCESPVHVDGPYLKVHCGSCQSDIDFPEEVWKDLMEDVRDETPGFKQGEGSSSTIFGHFNMSMTYGALKPYCIPCKRDYDMKAVIASGTERITCPDCKGVSPVMPVPDWFAEAFPGAKYIVGAWPEGEDVDLGQEPSAPVAFSCPQCAGSLLIDGTDRLVPCEYCNTRVYLPDDLWLRLHPVKKKQRWFVGFERT